MRQVMPHRNNIELRRTKSKRNLIVDGGSPCGS
jgi:hypothetical protein